MHDVHDQHYRGFDSISLNRRQCYFYTNRLERLIKHKQDSEMYTRELNSQSATVCAIWI